MVARSEDKPRSPAAKQSHTDRRVDELARTVGRGAPALRDASGNVLEMNANAPYPLLGPQGIDAAVAFTPDGTVKITDPTTAEDRDLTARDFTARDLTTRGIQAAYTIGTDYNLVARGDVNVAGNAICTSVAASGNVQSNTVGCNTIGVGTANAGVVNTGSTYMRGGQILCPGGNISTDPPGGGVGSMNSANYYGGTFHGTGDFTNGYLVSDVRLKEAFSAVDQGDLDTLLAAPVQRWRWRSGTSPDDGRGHVGPVAQDMPEVVVVENDDGRLSVDQMTYSGLLLALCQRQQRQIVDLTTRIETLEARR